MCLINISAWLQKRCNPSKGLGDQPEGYSDFAHGMKSMRNSSFSRKKIFQKCNLRDLLVQNRMMFFYSMYVLCVCFLIWCNCVHVVLSLVIFSYSIFCYCCPIFYYVSWFSLCFAIVLYFVTYDCSCFILVNYIVDIVLFVFNHYIHFLTPLAECMEYLYLQWIP